MAKKKMSYGEVEAALFRFLVIHPEREGTMRARMKQWRDRQDFPVGMKVGKGSRAEYGADAYFQYCFLGDLLKIGMTPERGILITKKLWPDISNAIYDAMLCVAGRADHRHYLSISVNTLAGMQEIDHPGELGFWLQIGGFTSRDLEIATASTAAQLGRISTRDIVRARRRVGISMRADLIMELDTFVATALFALNNYQGVFPPPTDEDLERFREGVFFMSEGVQKWADTSGTVRGASLFHDPEPSDWEADKLPFDKETINRFHAVSHSAPLNCADVLGVCSAECARELQPDAEGNTFNPRWREPLPWAAESDEAPELLDEDDHLSERFDEEDEDDEPEVEEAA